MKKLNELLDDISYDIDINGITDDSRLVKEGYLFVATKGYNVDHFNYIQDAINNGCAFIICDRELDIDFLHAIYSDINNLYLELCRKFYNLNLDNFHFIGITGTDGKTTTSTIVKNVLDDFSYIGSNGVSAGDKNYSTSNTTPCVSELYSDLNTISGCGYSNVVMEVSSEALLHHRVDDLRFDIVAFTNITGDHLNVHKSFDNYVKCKLRLLDLVKENGYVVVNGDDENLQKINCKNLYTFGFNSSNDFTIIKVENVSKYVNISVKYKDNIYDILSPYKGIFNVYNVVLAFIICLLYGVDSSLIISRIKNLLPVSGRCEFLDFGQKFDIVLDYAHTINGIKNILEAFSDYDEIITVTGCAGGREVSKRKVIGKLIMEKSNISIFTMDDPRNESVDKIIDDMVGDSKDYFRIVDREEAISYALNIASENSVVLILGKGRDNYMAIGDKKIKYNDYDVIKNYFSN
jgi:UDP-N-acetylmuramoyl-L-alanyl-D-glutamate--2,6-diaminopimelate ligase